jgi:hypothetical protein
MGGFKAFSVRVLIGMTSIAGLSAEVWADACYPDSGSSQYQNICGNQSFFSQMVAYKGTGSNACKSGQQHYRCKAPGTNYLYDPFAPKGSRTVTQLSAEGKEIGVSDASIIKKAQPPNPAPKPVPVAPTGAPPKPPVAPTGAPPKPPVAPTGVTGTSGTTGPSGPTDETPEQRRARINDENNSRDEIARLNANRAGFTKDDNWGKAKLDNDPCRTAKGIDAEKFGCAGTQKLVKTAEVTNTATQMLGNIAAQVTGQGAVQNAAQDGTQSGAIRAAAEAQEKVADTQMTIGKVNTAMGVLQYFAGMKHKSKAEELFNQVKGEHVSMNSNGSKQAEGRDDGEHGYASGNVDLTAKTLKNFNLNGGALESVDETLPGRVKAAQASADEASLKAKQALAAPGGAAVAQAWQARAEQFENQAALLNGQYKAQLAARDRGFKTKSSQVKNEVDSIGNQAGGEHMKAAEDAKAGGLSSAITGITQYLAARMQKSAAELNKDSANKLGAQGGNLPGFDGLAGGGDPDAPRQGYNVNPTGEQTSEAVAQQDKKDDTGGLGDPTGNPNAGKDPVGGPLAPGDFKAGAAPGGNGAPAGGGLGGGGGLSPSAPMTEDGAPRYANAMANPDHLEAGATPGRSGGGGNGATDTGPDLSGLLAKFLPQKEDEAKKGNGILDYGAKRTLASDGNESLLDRGANIFERIHKTYQEKAQRGVVGLN